MKYVRIIIIKLFDRLENTRTLGLERVIKKMVILISYVYCLDTYRIKNGLGNMS